MKGKCGGKWPFFVVNIIQNCLDTKYTHPLGPVKDMTTGGDQIRAGGFKHNALMVCVV